MALEMGDSGITAETCETLSEAMDRVKRGGIDAAVLDLNLEDASRVEAVQVMAEAQPKMPLIVVTGMGDEMEGAALAAGAEDYLEKPVASDLLIKAIRHAAIRREVKQQFNDVRESMASTDQALRAAGDFKQSKEKIEREFGGGI